jgi:hypothetical protein
MSLEDSDPKVPPRPLPQLTTSGEGNTVDIGRDDLVQNERRRLGDYLSLLTQKNEFPIKAGSELITLRTPNGNPVAISDTDRNAEKTYIDTISETGNVARSLFEKTSDTGLLDTDTAFKIKKGKSDEVYKTGTEYFREIDQQLGNAEIPRRVDEALLANNRFNEKNPALLPDEKEGSTRNNLGGLIIQPVLGKHLPKKFSNDGTAEAAEIVNIEKLKHFGMITMLQASGEVVVPTDLSNPDNIKGALIAGAPGLARIGQRIPSTRFDGVKIINEAYPTYQKGIRDLTPKGGNVVPSYGSPNNPFAPFAAFGTGASQTSAVIMSLTVSNLLRALAVTVNTVQQKRNLTNTTNAISNIIQNTPDPLSTRRSYLGSSEPKDSSESYIVSKGKLNIDLAPTTNEYFDCLEAGINEFFGFTGGSAGSRFVNQTATSARNSGYQNTILREILRSTTDVFLQQLNPLDLKLNTKMDIDKDPSGGNIGLQVLGNAIDFITQINNSKLLKFMNILATIGDNVLKAQSAEDNNSNFSNMNVDDIIDSNQNVGYGSMPNINVLQMKSKLSSQFGSTLAWNASTTPSSYLIPQSLINGATLFDTDPSRFDNIPKIKESQQIINSNRLSADFVTEIENQLEASYMPFYFHDLRTNEIISFHAFLESLNDSFNVEYNETDSYGRVGKIRTYKNTNRSISLGFSVVATNENGFDEMWFKINKLITLLYPQWTEGRVLDYGTQRFVQPFSQLPKSSPLIRLRVGDIIKSNYSKFELARLFGIGQGDRSFAVNTEEATQQINQDVVNDRQAYIVKRLEETNVQHIFKPGEHAILAPSTRSSSTRANPDLDYIKLETASNTTTRNSSANRTTRTANVTSLVSVIVRERQSDGRYKISFVQNGANYLSSDYYLVPATSLTADKTYIESEANSRFPQPTIQQTNPNAIEEFFNPTQNPIVKSFESTKGKGLAGFITSFNFEIDQNTIWNTEIGSKAPKMLKIQINFEPSHDLNPGIDNNGFMTAPLYNIGKIMNNVARNKSSTELSQDRENINTNIPWRIRNRGN